MINLALEEKEVAFIHYILELSIRKGKQPVHIINEKGETIINSNLAKEALMLDEKIHEQVISQQPASENKKV